MLNTSACKNAKVLSLGILIVMTLAIQFSGCIQPLDEAMVTVAKDEFAPRIVLIPPDGNVYRSTLVITGSVEDFVDAGGTKTGSLKKDSLRWAILNKAADKYNGAFVLDSENNFSISIDTSDLSELIVLEVSAVDLSGNTGVEEITLEPYLLGPYVSITSPQDNEEWANELTKTVIGKAKNSYMDNGVGEVDFDTLSVYISQTENSQANPGNLIINEEDGAFSFSFATDGLSARQPITVSVSDLNGISYQKIIYIVSSSEGPYIAITSPANRSFFDSLVEVTGSVRATSSAASGTVGITLLEVSLVGDATSSCTYVLDTATGEWTRTVPDGFTLSWDCGMDAGETDGDFFFSFYTAGRENDQLVEVVAENINRRRTVSTLTLLDDKEGPYITVNSPGDYELYSSTVTVTGAVRNNSNDFNLDEIDTLTWSVPGSTVTGGAVDYDPGDGSFTFNFDIPDSQSGMLSILISGTDINNNETVEYIMLLDDREGPIISINAPEQNSLFGAGENLILISGTIRNSENEAGSGPSIVESSWAVIGSSVVLNGVLDLSGGDDFSINLDTDGITESSISLIISASGVDGYESSYSLTLQNDRKAPAVSFAAPGEMSYYYDEISFSGTVTDADAVAPIDASDVDDIGSVTWEVLGEAAAGTLSIPSNGAFTVSGINSTGYAGNKTIRITAVDKNGNTSIAYRTLLEHTEGPTIYIANPVCYPYYDHIFTLSGNVSHDGGIDQVNQTPGNLQWQFAGDASWTNFTIDGSGNFSIGSIDTTGRTGTQIIRVRALDLNGDIGLEEFLLLNDNTGVDMTVVKPASGSFYASVVPVEVNISDYADLAASGYLTWQLIGQGASGTFTNNGSGNYTAVIDSGSYTSDLTLRIVAVDVHGNTTDEVISLLYGESTIPTFNVESTNGSVIVTWEETPLSVAYNVYYATDGSTPILGLGSYPSGGTYKATDLISGDSITGLQNGDRHVFILEAELSGGYDPSISGEVTAVPLSPLSYCPSVRQEEPGAVILEWPDYGGGTGYAVWRSLDKGAIWQKISGQLSVNRFTDTGVNDGDLAWYKIRPVNYSNVESYYTAIKVHYLDTVAEFSSADSIIQPLKSDMTIFEYDGSKYLASYTALSGGANRMIEIHDISNPQNITAAAERVFSETIESIPDVFIATAENYIFMASYDDGSADGHQLVVYSFDPLAGTITLEEDLCLGGISYGGTVLDGQISGLSAWYGDDGDVDTDPEFWVFINSGSIADTPSGMFIAKVTPGGASAVVNLVSVNTAYKGFDGTPHIYSEDDGAGLKWKITIFNNEAYSIQTLADFPSYDLSAVSLSDFDSYTMGGSPSWARYTATDGDNFFIADSNVIYAYDESDELRYASYTLLQQPAFLDCTNGYLIAASDEQYLTSFKISDIDYGSHTMTVDREWRKLYSQGACSDGIAFLSTEWHQTIDIINIGFPALAITPYNSLLGSVPDQMDLKQNILYGDLLYTYNASTGNLLRWELDDLQNDPTLTPMDDIDVTILVGGIFAAGEYCYSVRNSLYKTDFASGTTTEMSYQSDPDVGTIWAQGQYQTAERFGHYLFTAGLVELGSPRVLGTYDIGPLASNNLKLLSYNYEATGGWLSLLRAGNYVIALQSDSEELIITDVSDWKDIRTANRIDVPSEVSPIPNQLTFLPYGGYIFFNYYDSGYLYLLALDIDKLETGTWDDLIEIDKFDITWSYGQFVTNALCASGDYLFTAYSSYKVGPDDGISGIRSYKLAETAEMIQLDGIYTYENGIEGGTPVSGLRTDGEYLYLIRGDLDINYDSVPEYYGGIEVFSIDENF